MQIFLVRTDQQNWGKGLTLEDAIKNASLSLDSKFTITVFEREALTMEDISVSEFDGSAEYPKDARHMTIRCNGIMKALGISVEDLLTRLDDWATSIPDANKARDVADRLQHFNRYVESQFDEEDICRPIKK
jgi:hypothetical protein